MHTTASYDPAQYAALHAAEDRHFWFQSRNRLIMGLVSGLVSDLRPPYRVLEIGCGGGNVARVLNRICSDGLFVGMDYFTEGLQYAQKRGVSCLVQGDARRSPFGKQFHVIGLFDVLEHIEDDRQLLREIFDMLSPNGSLVVTVPACGTLWSYFDKAAGHYRRYEPKDLISKLTETGYTVEYSSYCMASLYPLLWLGRRWQNRRGTETTSARIHRELHVNPVVNSILKFLLYQESRLVARRFRLPFGTSLVAVVRKASPLAAEHRLREEGIHA